VCPGDEFDVRTFQNKVFGREYPLTETHGVFEKGVVAYASSPTLREDGTSGGLVTAILEFLLENGQIDGALVITSDEETLWKGRPMIARTKEDLRRAMKSKYAISPTNSGFAEIREVAGRYAIVGLPCQIHGFHKAAELDARIRERVVLSIGLFCHAAIEHEAFRVIWDTLGDRSERVTRFISRVGKHPGTPYVQLDDGSQYPVYFGSKKGYRPTSIEVINVLYRLYTPVRCTTCFDAMSEFADISVGDPWMAPPEDHVDFFHGWSFALLRTKRGSEVFEQAKRAGAIQSVDVTEREVRSSNKLMAIEKHWRAFRVIETLRRQGKPIPSYGDPLMRLPRHNGIQFIKTEMHIFSHLFCFIPGLRKQVLKFFLGNGGYWLFWLNSLRRGVRTGTRDLVARVRRKLFGRE